MGGGVSNLISENQRAAMHIALLETMPARVYALKEKRFKAGSFYDTADFAEQKKHVPAFSALGLHEWSVSQLWRHFTTVSHQSLCEVRMHEVTNCAEGMDCARPVLLGLQHARRVHCM